MTRSVMTNGDGRFILPSLFKIVDDWDIQRYIHRINPKWYYVYDKEFDKYSIAYKGDNFIFPFLYISKERAGFYYVVEKLNEALAKEDRRLTIQKIIELNARYRREAEEETRYLMKERIIKDLEEKDRGRIYIV